MKQLCQKSIIILVFCCFAVVSLSCEQPNGPADSPIVLIGDSIFALYGDIKDELEYRSGEEYRSYCVSGSEMENGMLGDIPDQYKEAIKTNPHIKTVIMDGGGNDIQVGGSFYCSNSANGVSNLCKSELQKALTAADQLFRDMRADGVENIIYMNYFYILNQRSKPAFDWMHEQMETLAKAYDCILVDPMPYMTPDLIRADRIHPTEEGGHMLGDLIYDAMIRNNVDTTGGSTSSGGGCGAGR